MPFSRVRAALHHHYHLSEREQRRLSLREIQHLIDDIKHVNPHVLSDPNDPAYRRAVSQNQQAQFAALKP